jgi:heme a synthase
MMTQRFIYRLALFATLLALFVVMLGAYTRLRDAGLGCPDWPGCYGQLTVPNTSVELQQAQRLYPAQPVESHKAWIEMVHRYIASTVGFLILILAARAWCKPAISGLSRGITLTLIAVVIFQGVLGMWTVTWRVMPVIVMSHLLGGMAVVSLLTWLSLRLKGFANHFNKDAVKPYRFWAAVGLIIIVLQIFLGGWTSTNYAALICPDFPTCQAGHWLPQVDFNQAFNFLTPIGPDYQGGLLNTAARITIQMMHRFGALLTLVYIGGLALYLFFKVHVNLIRRLAILIAILLLIQIVLGILNVIWLLPISIAVLHNGIAALLLVALVALNYSLYAK